MASPTLGSLVRIERGEVASDRVGQLGSVVSITVLDTKALATAYGAPVGTTMCQVEFGDGVATEFPAALVEQVEVEEQPEAVALAIKFGRGGGEG